MMMVALVVVTKAGHDETGNGGKITDHQLLKDMYDGFKLSLSLYSYDLDCGLIISRVVE